MKIKKRSFGVLSTGQKVSLFTVSNGAMSFSVTNYGCTITSIILPSKNGGEDDVVLGYSTLDGYTRNFPFFGSLIGRYANRIAGARFELCGETVSLAANDRGNCLHGGRPGWHTMVWKAETFSNGREAGVAFSRTSPAGEQGFPGNLDVRVSYGLTTGNDIVIRYSARTDAPTPVNLTHHTYFNLAGHDSGPILDHTLQLFCDRYLPADQNCIPIGAITDVVGTPFDFRSPKPIGQDIGNIPGGYDHTWEINRAGEAMNPVAGVYEPKTGRSMTVYSTQPGVQFYTCSAMQHEIGKNGAWYGNSAGFCLETQHFPDSPNRPDFPDTILLPEDRYRHENIWHFDFD
jgi:Galactose mutarotase and related enzymes